RWGNDQIDGVEIASIDRLPNRTEEGDLVNASARTPERCGDGRCEHFVARKEHTSPLQRRDFAEEVGYASDIEGPGGYVGADASTGQRPGGFGAEGRHSSGAQGATVQPGVGQLLPESV